MDYRDNDPFWRRMLRLDDCPGSDSGTFDDPDAVPKPKSCGRRLTDEEWAAKAGGIIEAVDRRR